MIYTKPISTVIELKYCFLHIVLHYLDESDRGGIQVSNMAAM